MRIIFVDDTEADRILVRDLLQEKYNWTVVTCASHDEFSEYMDRIDRQDVPRPSIAIFDMQMDDDDTGGLQMLKDIRARLPEIPAIIMSHSALKSVVEDSYRSGASSYIQKPTDRHEFGEKMDILQKYWTEISRTTSQVQ